MFLNKSASVLNVDTNCTHPCKQKEPVEAYKNKIVVLEFIYQN